MTAASSEDLTITSVDLTRRAAEAALGRKAEELVALDVRELTSYAQFFLICHGSNSRQVVAIAEAICADLKAGCGEIPLGVEGLESARWVLVDFGDLVVHVFDEQLRRFYDIEGLWVDAPRLELPAEPRPVGTASAYA